MEKVLVLSYKQSDGVTAQSVLTSFGNLEDLLNSKAPLVSVAIAALIAERDEKEN